RVCRTSGCALVGGRRNWRVPLRGGAEKTRRRQAGRRRGIALRHEHHVIGWWRINRRRVARRGGQGHLPSAQDVAVKASKERPRSNIQHPEKLQAPRSKSSPIGAF